MLQAQYTPVARACDQVQQRPQQHQKRNPGMFRLKKRSTSNMTYPGKWIYKRARKEHRGKVEVES